jgi:hypothetical protein
LDWSRIKEVHRTDTTPNAAITRADYFNETEKAEATAETHMQLI